jgi:hypothetical protein
VAGGGADVVVDEAVDVVVDAGEEDAVDPWVTPHPAMTTEIKRART